MTTIKCQHEDCDHEAMCCYLEPGDDKPDGFYCGDHANIHGFCPVCGMFWGGISSFEMNGICDYCKDELDDENEDWDDYWEEDDMEFDV